MRLENRGFYYTANENSFLEFSIDELNCEILNTMPDLSSNISN